MLDTNTKYNTLGGVVSVIILLLMLFVAFTSGSHVDNINYGYVGIVVLLLLVIFFAVKIMRNCDYDENYEVVNINQQNQLTRSTRPTRLSGPSRLTKKVRFTEPVKEYEKIYDYPEIKQYQDNFFTFRNDNFLASSDRFDTVDKVNIYKDNLSALGTNIWEVYDKLTVPDLTTPVHFDKNTEGVGKFYPYHGGSGPVVRPV